MAMASWKLIVCGISHKTSELTDREPLQVDRDSIAEANAILGKLPGVLESVIVSTCNRVEFYLVLEKSAEPADILLSFYSQFKNQHIADALDKFYTMKRREAAEHLFRVVAGVDSMIIGENQIVGQLKDAYSSSCSVKSAGKIIHRLFHQAFRVGKAVRSDTEIGKGACSVSGTAVSLLKSKIAANTNPAVLFIGVNQMIAIAAAGLSGDDQCRFMFANRTREKAVALAEKFAASAHTLDELPELLGRADVVVTCTSSPVPIITKEMMRAAGVAGSSRRRIVMDLAVPRDVESDIDELTNIEILDLEDIRRFVEQNQKQVLESIPEAEAIIERRLDEFMYWYSHVLHEPLYNGFGDTFEAIRHEEFGPVIKKLSPEMQYAVDKASRRLINRLLAMKVRAETEPEK
ncbi:MAG: glutamyl-tRNA reductase [candidate division Zixibacteria bacterium]|nr:glutamyl-tRNA reductase [candidate division Zixibacteria bacterium]MBU1471288.1 glutamyl-tRNA reductase [candidate division Zixibacteria bacterium]MBU2625678.1 glutamyl-tRNA reductase [candidate division Zixibacteria bacterium]